MTLYAYEAGKSAFTNPKGKGNPYNQDEENDLWNAWNDGYRDAQEAAGRQQWDH